MGAAEQGFEEVALYQRAKAKHEFVKWMVKFEWIYAVTGTFRHPVTGPHATRRVGEYVKRLNRKAHPTYWVWAVEEGDYGEHRQHVHLALGGDVDKLTAELIKTEWQHGNIQVEPMHDAALWIAYIGKGIVAGQSEYEVDAQIYKKSAYLERRVARQNS